MTVAEVIIDGVRYVPVVDGNVDADKLLHVLVAQWGGDNWRELYPEAVTYLRVLVSDALDPDDGEPLLDFIANTIEHMRSI